MAINKLNTDKIFSGIRSQFWRELAEFIKQLIEMDMRAGEVQAYISQERVTSGGAKHYSKGYKKAKQKLFTRLDGKKYKQYAGVSVIDNTTNQVNLRATGQTIRGLHLETVLTNGVILSYMPKDSDKIIFNHEMGRVITTFNKKNRDKTLEMYSKELDKSLQKWCKETIVINA